MPDLFGTDWNGITGGRLTPPQTFNFAQHVLAPRARTTPDKVAVVSVSRDGRAEEWSYAQVAEASGRLAAALHQRGITKGDRVLLLMPRNALFLVALAACHHIGAIPVPCVTQIAASEVAYRAERSGARAAITSGELARQFSDVRIPLQIATRPPPGWQDLDALLRTPREPPAFAEMPAETPALMYFTSGSSGPPKPVILPASAVFVRSWQPWHQFHITPDDVIWTTSDTGWTRAASCLFYGAWFWGARSLIVDKNLTPDEKIAMLVAHGVTIYGAVATELRQIMAAARPRPLPRLRLTISAGEAMTAQLSESWTAFSKAPLIVGYGQSETCTSTLTAPDAEPVNGMIGQPLEGNDVTVLDEQGAPCAPREHGEIAFRGDNPGLMLGYWDNGSIRPAFSRDGWYRTGDAGYLDEAGNLFFVGRRDDIISSSGYRIGPTEVENALMSHPAVQECAVVAASDPLRGEVVKACIVLRPGMVGSAELTKALQEHVKSRIAPYKYPRVIEYLPELPRTNSGKISRRLLREAAGQDRKSA